MIFFGERWSFGLSAFSLICLKAPFWDIPIFPARKSWILLLACWEMVAQEQNEAFLSGIGWTPSSALLGSEKWVLGSKRNSPCGSTLRQYRNGPANFAFRYETQQPGDMSSICKFNKLPVWLADRIKRSQIAHLSVLQLELLQLRDSTFPSGWMINCFATHQGYLGIRLTQCCYKILFYWI